MKPPFPYHRALVTGASSGLGAALCKRLVSEGCEVWGTARDISRIDASVHPVRLDLADADALRNFAADVLPGLNLDLLVNNAGSGVFGDLDENSESDIRAQYEVMLAAPTLLCRAALPGMKARGRGCIANVSSLAARFPLPCMAVYNASKAGLTALSLTLMAEVGKSGVRVVDFQPGDFNSGFLGATRRIGGGDSAWQTAEQHLVTAPDAHVMSGHLMRAIARDRSASVCAGTFLQARLATFVQHVLPEALFRRILLAYLD